MNFELDQQRVLDTILQLPEVSAQAREEGSSLVDSWIQACLQYDLEHETLAVESGFFIELDDRTFVVGTQDRIARDGFGNGQGIFGSEWKSCKHRTKSWGPEEWYQSISEGHQVATYAAGLRYGQFPFIEDDSIFQQLRHPFNFDSATRILVRAVSKSRPPEIWPTPEGQFVYVTPQRIESVLSTFRNTAASIRAMQKTGEVPWQVPGLHCTNCFRYSCEYKEEQCNKGVIAPWGPLFNLRAHSPGSQKVVEWLVGAGKIRLDDCEDTVILSASGLSTYQQCPERWRLSNLAGEGESNENLDIGSVLHAGLGELYSQIGKWQKGE